MLSYVLLMVLAGIGIPLMATLNSGLGARLHNPVMATLVLLLVGSAVTASYALLIGALSNPFQGQLALYWYCGGFFVAFYILSITWVAPRFGIGNAIAFVLLGQLISMAVIDHFGVLGALKSAITPQRLLGLLLMAVGVFLAVKRQ